MEKDCPKRSLQEESISSSNNESLPTPAKQSNISKHESPNGSPKEPSTSTESLKMEIQENLSEGPSTSETESHGLQLLCAAASKIEQVKEHESQDTKGALVKKEWVIEIEEDSPKDAAAKALKLEYMLKYASVYSKELLFAVDVMTLARHLNQLPCKWIIYVTSGEQPKSPCDDILDEALGILWTGIKDSLGGIFKDQFQTKQIDYPFFQRMVLHMAEKAEETVYDEKSFLFYCMTLAHWAVFAELNGVTDAPEFVPLVMCRTFQKLKDSGKIPFNFWDRVAEAALDIIFGISTS